MYLVNLISNLIKSEHLIYQWGLSEALLQKQIFPSPGFPEQYVKLKRSENHRPKCPDNWE